MKKKFTANGFHSVPLVGRVTPGTQSVPENVKVCRKYSSMEIRVLEDVRDKIRTKEIEASRGIRDKNPHKRNRSITRYER